MCNIIKERSMSDTKKTIKTTVTVVGTLLFILFAFVAWPITLCALLIYGAFLILKMVYEAVKRA